MTSGEPVVFVVDDDQAVRGSLRFLLESVDLKVATCAAAKEFVGVFRRGQPGCLITDVRIPGLSGLDLQQKLAEAGVELPVIVVTGHGDISMAVRAMKAGAFDFIEKPYNDQVMLDVVQQAVAHSLQHGDSRDERRAVEARLAQLTPREREVLDRVVDGGSNKSIARDLEISEKTVESHRARVMEKMEAGSLAELVRMALGLD